jgi:hypothetical protein
MTTTMTTTPPVPKAISESPLPRHDDGYGIADCNGKRVQIYGDETSVGNELTNRKLIIAIANTHAALLAAAKGIVEQIKYDWLNSELQEMLVGKLEAAIAAAEEPAP